VFCRGLWHWRHLLCAVLLEGNQGDAADALENVCMNVRDNVCMMNVLSDNFAASEMRGETWLSLLTRAAEY